MVVCGLRRVGVRACLCRWVRIWVYLLCLSASLSAVSISNTIYIYIYYMSPLQQEGRIGEKRESMRRCVHACSCMSSSAAPLQDTYYNPQTSIPFSGLHLHQNYRLVVVAVCSVRPLLSLLSSPMDMAFRHGSSLPTNLTLHVKVKILLR